METIRYAFDFWWFYMTNEGNSAVPVAKFITIGTGAVCAAIAFLILWPFLRRMRRGPPLCFCRPNDPAHTCSPECYDHHLRHSHWGRNGWTAGTQGTEATADQGGAGGSGTTYEHPCNCYIAAGVTHAIACTCMKNGIRANAPWGKWSAPHEGEAVRPLTEGYTVKGGHNSFPSQITIRLPAPGAINPKEKNR